jgi:enamine deaminase RidA (YjgF/YER057c/UK114 family)
MQKRCIQIAGVPKPAAPYSPAVAAVNLLFVSGQVAVKPDGSGPLKGATFAEETRLVLDNLRRVIEGAGSKSRGGLAPQPFCRAEWISRA